MSYPISLDDTKTIVAKDVAVAKACRSVLKQEDVDLCAMRAALAKAATQLEDRAFDVANCYASLIRQMLEKRKTPPMSICAECARFLSKDSEQWTPAVDDLYARWHAQ